jgi:hypothetical protein
MPEAALFAKGGNPGKATIQREIATARAATARFHQVERALEAGYEAPPVEECVDVPGLGGMGYHFVHEGLLMSADLDPAQPEALLYVPKKNGKLELVAVEYIWLGPASADPPELFGQPFHWNPHLNLWALHLWIWQNNPAGIFADFNPTVSCQYAPSGD